MEKPISIPLDAEDLLNISEWNAEIELGSASLRARNEYLKSIVRRSGAAGRPALSRDGRYLLVFPQSNNETPRSEESANNLQVVEKEA